MLYDQLRAGPLSPIRQVLLFFAVKYNINFFFCKAKPKLVKRKWIKSYLSLGIDSCFMAKMKKTEVSENTHKKNVDYSNEKQNKFQIAFCFRLIGQNSDFAVAALRSNLMMKVAWNSYLRLVRDELEVEHGGEGDEDDEDGNEEARGDPGSLLRDRVELHPAENGDLNQEEQNP